MRKHVRRRWLGVVLAAAGTLTGCKFLDREPDLSYVGEPGESYYRDYAQTIDYPHVHAQPPEQVIVTGNPRTVLDRERAEVWDLPLQEAIHLSLANNRIVRTTTTLLTGQNPVLNDVQQNQSVYDPAIQASGVLFGNRGEEAALSAFDAQLTTNLLWGRNEQFSNGFGGFDTGTGDDDGDFGSGDPNTNPLQPGVTDPATGGAGVGGGNVPGFESVSETASYSTRLAKTFGYGGQLGVFNNVNYLGTNSQGVLFPSSYTTVAGVDYRHPLWAGAGTEFTRIAGPITQSFGGITGVTQGVAIARINNDITIADFELAVRNQLRNVEDLYWNLYLQYRLYDAAVTARNSALASWRKLRTQQELGAGSPADEAQARDRYFETRAQAERALSTLYEAELTLRRMMGLPVNDGRVIRPCDDPPTAEFIPDWQLSLTDALTGRPELRRQKWQIKSLELQLMAAKSLVAPRLDFVSSYQVNGFGDQLLGESDDDPAGTAAGLDSAFETLTQGDQTGWTLGFEFNMPLGLRAAHTQVRNIELRLAKQKELLAAAEQEVAIEVAAAFQNLAEEYTTARDNYARREAASQRVELFQAEYEAGRATLDRVLEAQASLAAAEQAYFTSLAQYAQAINAYHFTTGTILEQDNVRLAEDGWVPPAYEQARRRAEARAYAIENPLLDAEPAEFVEPGKPHLAPATPPPVMQGVPSNLLPPSAPPVATPPPAGDPNRGQPPAAPNGTDPFRAPEARGAAQNAVSFNPSNGKRGPRPADRGVQPAVFTDGESRGTGAAGDLRLQPGRDLVP